MLASLLQSTEPAHHCPSTTGKTKPAASQPLEETKEIKDMQKFIKNLHILLLIINSVITISIADNDLPTNSFCGKVQIKPPFLNPNSTSSSSSSSSSSSPLNNMVLCKSQKPYLRTAIGLFPISSINYTSKTLTISHPLSSSSTRNYISPSTLFSGFPNPPSPDHTNSLLLLNCSKKPEPISDFLKPCTGLRLFFASDSEIKEMETITPYSSCLLIEDMEKLGDVKFHPKDMKCSHYRRVHRRRSLSDHDDGDGDYGNKELEVGTKLTFDINTHKPDFCKKCETPNGDCGAALRCVCHAKECKDQVVNMGGNLNPIGDILCSLLSFIVLMVFWRN